MDRLVPVCLFAVFGAMFGVWQVLIADLHNALALSTGRLGAAITIGMVASIPTMVFAGRAADRWGHRTVIAISGGFMGFVWIGFSLVNSFFMFVCLLLLFASASGTYDVGINAVAMGSEQRTGRRVMALLHASFSAGAAAGALATGGLLAAGVPFRRLYVAVAVLLWVVIGLATRAQHDVGPIPSLNSRTRPGTRYGLFRHRALMLLAVITALGFLYEGVMETWSTIYLRDSLALTAIVGASGAAVFHLAMMVGRLGTAGAVIRFGRRSTLQVAGVVSALGMVVALATERTVPILVGFLIVGLALAGVAPIAFSLAGDEAPGRAGEASAVITTVGYTGFFLGPSLIGGLADLIGLRIALATGCVTGLAITLLSRQIQTPSQDAQTRHGAG